MTPHEQMGHSALWQGPPGDAVPKNLDQLQRSTVLSVAM